MRWSSATTSVSTWRSSSAKPGAPRCPGARLRLAVLSAALEPPLAHLDLAAIAQRFGVECGPRHTALGDAITAARLFGRLVERLEAAGIHTVAAASIFAERVHLLR